jgi:hypothetical protein
MVSCNGDVSRQRALITAALNTWFLRRATMGKKSRRWECASVRDLATYLSGMKNWVLEADEAEEEDWSRRWW